MSLPSASSDSISKLPSVLPGVYTRTAVRGHKEFFNFSMQFDKKPSISFKSRCIFEVGFNKETQKWMMAYSRDKMSKVCIFKMPHLSNSPAEVEDVIEISKSGQERKSMTVMRNETGNVFIFNEKKPSVTIRRTFSKDWMKVKQVTSVKGTAKKCVEIFEKLN